MIEIKEVKRYLGYGKNEPDERTLDLIHECIFAVQEAANRKSVSERFDLSIEGDCITAGGFSMHSSNLSKNLSGCSEVIFFAATLGNEVDILMNRYLKTNITKAAIVQAVAAAAIEDYCNSCQLEIEKALHKEKLFVRPRFSPGYGDLALSYQQKFLDILKATKRIGIVLTDGDIMLPEKSVTAIMGVSSFNSKCHIEGCEACNNKRCAYRRDS